MAEHLKTTLNMFGKLFNEKIGTDELIMKLIHDGGPNSSEVIFFHGVNSSGEKAFTNKNGVLWIKDLLPEQFVDNAVSIWSYTYRNDLFSINSNQPNSIKDQAVSLFDEIEVRKAARKSFVLVGHSYGGLLIKQFLLLLAERDKRDLLHRLKGVVFYGTPHRGAISWPIQYICCLLGCSTHSFQILQQGHSELIYLHSKFMELMEEWKFSAFSFFEDDKLHGMIVVPRWSAVHDLSDYTTNMRAVGRNHKDMCKHTSADESTFIRFVSVVKGMLGNVAVVEDESANGSLLHALPVHISPPSPISDDEEELRSGPAPSIESCTSSPETICGNISFRGSTDSYNTTSKRTLEYLHSVPGTPVESYDIPAASRLTALNSDAVKPAVMHLSRVDSFATRIFSTKLLLGKMDGSAFSPAGSLRRVATHLAATNNTKTSGRFDSDDEESKTSDHTEFDDAGALTWDEREQDCD